MDTVFINDFITRKHCKWFFNDYNKANGEKITFKQHVLKHFSSHFTSEELFKLNDMFTEVNYSFLFGNNYIAFSLYKIFKEKSKSNCYFDIDSFYINILRFLLNLDTSVYIKDLKNVEFKYFIHCCELLKSYIVIQKNSDFSSTIRVVLSNSALLYELFATEINDDILELCNKFPIADILQDFTEENWSYAKDKNVIISLYRVVVYMYYSGGNNLTCELNNIILEFAKYTLDIHPGKHFIECVFKHCVNNNIGLDNKIGNKICLNKLRFKFLKVNNVYPFFQTLYKDLVYIFNLYIMFIPFFKRYLKI